MSPTRCDSWTGHASLLGLGRDEFRVGNAQRSVRASAGWPAWQGGRRLGRWQARMLLCCVCRCEERASRQMRSSLGRAARRHRLRVSPRSRRQSYSSPSLSRAWACSLANRRTSQRNARSERNLRARHDANADADGSAVVLAASGRCNDGLIASAVVVASWLNNHHLLPHLRDMEAQEERYHLPDY